jgi:predicted nucleic acid-binding protein
VSDVLLDTNIVSALMVPDSPLYPRLRAVVQAGGTAFLSPVVDYEIRRGLIRKRAVTLSARFELVARQLTYRGLDASIWLRAAELWAHSPITASRCRMRTF